MSGAQFISDFSGDFSDVVAILTSLDSAIVQLKADAVAQEAVNAQAMALISGFSAQLTAAIASAEAAGVMPGQLAALTKLQASLAR